MSTHPTRTMVIETQRWPVAGSFTISRSSVTEIVVVIVSLLEGSRVVGRGECRPYPRYNETADGVTAKIEAHRDCLETGSIEDCLALCASLPGGAASNAVESAVVDMACRAAGQPAWQWLGVPQPQPTVTAFTLSSGTPDNMAEAAREASAYPLLKVKIGGDDPVAQLRAVLRARPDARYVIDANEALDADGLRAVCAAAQGFDIAMIEQPLPAGLHDRLPDLPEGAPPICADESLHSVADLPRLKAAGYRAVNVKLDKAGGPIKARGLMREARAQGFDVMAGCMVGTSLAMAPMVHLGRLADVLDLDGPLLLARDCDVGMVYEDARVSLPAGGLWG